MPAGENLGEEGRAYHRAKNMKLWTGIFEESLALTNDDQFKAPSRVQEVHFWKTPPEILYSMPIEIRTSWNKFHALKNSIGSLNKSFRVDGYQYSLAAVTALGTVRAACQDLPLQSEIITS